MSPRNNATEDELRAYKCRDGFIKEIHALCPVMGNKQVFHGIGWGDDGFLINIYWRSYTAAEDSALSEDEIKDLDKAWLQNLDLPDLPKTILTQIGNEDVIIRLLHQKDSPAFFT